MTQAAWRQHCDPFSARLKQIIVEVFPLPSLPGFWPYCCRLGPVVTPKLQARSDLLHLYGRPLRMLPALFGIAPLTTQLVEYHFCFYDGGRVDHSSLGSLGRGRHYDQS